MPRAKALSEGPHATTAPASAKVRVRSGPWEAAKARRLRGGARSALQQLTRWRWSQRAQRAEINPTARPEAENRSEVSRRLTAGFGPLRMRTLALARSAPRTSAFSNRSQRQQGADSSRRRASFI
ncbi:MAG: hypothetical protein HY855_16540 [Burkholderiales bacterium]|nr:hypothetical protein [Burkholderiales bacterium]